MPVYESGHAIIIGGERERVPQHSACKVHGSHCVDWKSRSQLLA